MLISVDPRRHIVVHPGDISAMKITLQQGGQGEVLVIYLSSGHELSVQEYCGNKSRLDLRAVHEQLMEATR